MLDTKSGMVGVLLDFKDIAQAKVPVDCIEMPILQEVGILKRSHEEYVEQAAHKISGFLHHVLTQGGRHHILPGSSFLERYFWKYVCAPENPEWQKMDALAVQDADSHILFHTVRGLIVPNGKARNGSTGAIRSGLVVKGSLKNLALLRSFLSSLKSDVTLTVLHFRDRGVAMAYPLPVKQAVENIEVLSSHH